MLWSDISATYFTFCVTLLASLISTHQQHFRPAQLLVFGSTWIFFEGKDLLTSMSMRPTA